jgi:hypothetical protein
MQVAGGDEARFAGAGIGDAGVDDERPDVAARQVIAAHLHRRRTEAVDREHPGRC